MNSKIICKVSLLLMSLVITSACTPGVTDNNNLSLYENTINHNTYSEFNVFNVNNSNLNVATNLKIEDKLLSWSGSEKNYFVSYFSNNTRTKIVETVGNAFNFADVVNENDIFCFRVGVLNNNQYELSREIYYNPNTFNNFTNPVYYFNEQLADYFIESQSELNHLMHYAYVYKIKELQIKLSDDFYKEINVNSGLIKNFENALSTSFEEGFLETMSLSYTFNVVNNSNKIIKIKLNFFGVDNPKLSLSKILTQDQFAKPSYQTKSYYQTTLSKKRDSNYNNFESDNNMKLVSVNTGEQLYWAIQDGATPVFESQNDTAYIIYNQAKNILREIICDDMTDTQKVLAIFDYITYNTIYDYQLVYSNSAGNNPFTQDEIITNFKSFYLEGVFEDGLAVCDGFSKAFSLLTNMEGIKSYRIVGNAGGGHAWNKVLIDNKWYVIDITWTELELYDYLSGEPKEYLTRKYFLISDGDVTTHKAHLSVKNKNYSSDVNYYFYNKFKFEYDDETYSLIIDSKQKAKDLLKFLWSEYLVNNINSIEAVLTSEVINNWASCVSEVKDELKFNNDVLKVYDGYIDDLNNLNFDLIKINDLKYGSVSIIQIHNTFLNLEQS